MPLPRDGVQLEYSPWFQTILGIMTIEFDGSLTEDVLREIFCSKYQNKNYS